MDLCRNPAPEPMRQSLVDICINKEVDNNGYKKREQWKLKKS